MKLIPFTKWVGVNFPTGPCFAWQKGLSTFWQIIYYQALRAELLAAVERVERGQIIHILGSET